MPYFFWWLVPPPSGRLPPLTMPWPPAWFCISTTITDDPASRATMAAGIPEAPEPITTTSASWFHELGGCWACADAGVAEPTPVAANAAVPAPRRSRSRLFKDIAALPYLFFGRPNPRWSHLDSGFAWRPQKPVCGLQSKACAAFSSPSPLWGGPGWGVVRGATTVHLARPPPPTPPHKGEGR